MKIRDYNQMMGYLTRPSKSTDPNQVKIDLEKTLNKHEDGPDLKSDLVIEDIEHPNQVSFDPTTRLFTNKDRTVSFKRYDIAEAHNKSIGVKNTKYYPGEATPEQFGEMAARVEKMKQQQGNSTEMKDFVNKFGGDDKPIIKKKIVTPVKLDFKPIVIPPPSLRRDPEMDRIENNFNKMVRDNEEEKRRNNNAGLAGLLGEIK